MGNTIARRMKDPIEDKILYFIVYTSLIFHGFGHVSAYSYLISVFLIGFGSIVRTCHIISRRTDVSRV